MMIREILNTTEHRPWGIPGGSWKFYQEWNNAIFLHWQVDLQELQKMVPHELEIDLYEGKPWISVVAFTMEKIRPKNLPCFPPISNFDEINIRTYVKSNDKTGVYFLSIEGGTQLSCKIAKGISELPYRYSTIKRTESQYNACNTEFSDKLSIQFTIKEEIEEKTELDRWLTERYALFQDTDKFINEFEIHHLEWQLNEVALTGLNFDYQRFNQLIKGAPHQTHYSTGVRVLAWGKIRRAKSSY